MKKIRLASASFGDDKCELTVRTSLKFRNYIIDCAFYNDKNTKSRKLSMHPRLKGKIPKMMEWYEHPDYDYYLWVDSKFILKEGFLEAILQPINDDKADIYLFAHPERSSIKSEMEFMIDKMNRNDSYLLDRYDGEILEEQVNIYLNKFSDNHLFYGGLFLYSNNLVKNKNYNLMTDWFLHCVLYHTQDQLWLPYLIDKHQVKYKVYDEHLFNNQYLGHI